MFPIGAFFIGVGTAAAIAAVLALVMAIADATIANYGEVKISINDGSKELTVDGGRSLLSTLTSEGIFIPSACGGRGSCGLCKLAVKSGAGEYAPTELPWITEADRKANVRLSCQVKVKREMQIVVPEELFSIKEYQTTVASIRDLTYDIKEVTLKLKDSQALDFKAGHYVQFVVPAYELTPDPVYRAYSISSSPSRKDAVELEVRLVPNGICTTYVFQHLKVGDSVNINGPYGEFHLRDSDRDILFVAGGSGMAPIKSILLGHGGAGHPAQGHLLLRGPRGARPVPGGGDAGAGEEAARLQVRARPVQPGAGGQLGRGEGSDHRGAVQALRAPGPPRGLPVRQPGNDRRQHQGVQGQGPAG